MKKCLVFFHFLLDALNPPAAGRGRTDLQNPLTKPHIPAPPTQTHNSQILQFLKRPPEAGDSRCYSVFSGLIL